MKQGFEKIAEKWNGNGTEMECFHFHFPFPFHFAFGGSAYLMISTFGGGSESIIGFSFDFTNGRSGLVLNLMMRGVLPNVVT